MNTKGRFKMHTYTIKEYMELYFNETGDDILKDDEMFGPNVKEVRVIGAREFNSDYEFSSVVGVIYEDGSMWVYGAGRDKEVFTEESMIYEIAAGMK